LPVSEVLPLAQGQVYTAPEALEAKLIDAIGYQDDAIHYLLRQTSLESAHVVKYAKPRSVVETLLGSQASASARGITLDADSLMKLAIPQMLYLAR
ncbi:MAG TPA: S49 family peptidase, partial [Isosphaeraceae bacterium]|nr:S49 family peptidase [Isosphaeraceae bacterium]